MKLDDKEKFVADAKAALDKKAFEKLGDMKSSVAKDFIMPEVQENDEPEKETDE